MSPRGVASAAVLAALLVGGAADATSRDAADQRRDLDLVASAQPSDQRRQDSERVSDERELRREERSVASDRPGEQPSGWRRWF